MNTDTCNITDACDCISMCQEMLDSFDTSQAQKLLKTTLPETGHSVVVAMRPKGGKASG